MCHASKWVWFCFTDVSKKCLSALPNGVRHFCSKKQSSPCTWYSEWNRYIYIKYQIRYHTYIILNNNKNLLRCGLSKTSSSICFLLVFRSWSSECCLQCVLAENSNTLGPRTPWIETLGTLLNLRNWGRWRWFTSSTLMKGSESLWTDKDNQ